MNSFSYFHIFKFSHFCYGTLYYEFDIESLAAEKYE